MFSKSIYVNKLLELDAQITINKETKKKSEPVSVKGVASENPLDEMLGALTDDLSAKGIAAKSKGTCPTCNRPVIGEAIAALAKVWHPGNIFFQVIISNNLSSD